MEKELTAQRFEEMVQLETRHCPRCAYPVQHPFMERCPRCFSALPKLDISCRGCLFHSVCPSDRQDHREPVQG